MWLSVMWIGVAGLGGCQSAKVAQPLTQELAGSEPQTQLEFWHTLATRPVTSNDEAFHGLLLYLDQRDDAPDYTGRVGVLQERGLLPMKFNRPADEAVTRGTLAVALVRAMDIKGGLTMRVFGPSQRYATRELMAMNLYPLSSPHQTFSGSEFIGVIGRMEDYHRVNPARSPAALLPSEIEQQQQAAPAEAETETATPAKP